MTEDDVPFLIVSDEYSCPAPPVVPSGADGIVLDARLLRNTRISGSVRDADGRAGRGRFAPR